MKSTEALTAKGRLFRHFVGRVAGLPVDGLENLVAKRALASYEVLRACEDALDRLREPLSETLFEAIGGLEDRALRTALLRIKRDVHNLRPLAEADVKTLTADLSSPVLEDLERYRALLIRRARALDLFREDFDRERAELRQRFRDSIRDEDFQKGLLLSSRALFDQVARFLKAPAESPGAKARQVERSLMRYYSRTVMKTTPFATFCAIVPGRFETSSERAKLIGDPRCKHSSLRLNKAIYQRLVKALLQRPAVRLHLPVELNPTLHSAAGRWVFLTPSGHQELFQRLAPGPVLDLLREMLAEHRQLALGTLVKAFLEHVDASREDAIAYLDRLLEIGFLRFHLGIREQEVRWDGPLRSLVAAIDDDLVRESDRFLEQYRRDADSYAEATVEQRRRLLEAISQRAERLFARLEPEETKSVRWTPLYEDAGAAASFHHDPGELGDTLAEFVALTSPLAGIRVEQANMRHFFESFYGPRAKAVPLLRFFEDYYREHFNDHLEAQNRRQDSHKLDENPFDLDVVARIQAAYRLLEQRLRELWRAAPECEEVVLERRDLEAITADLPYLTDPCRSVSVFAQYVPSPGSREDASRDRLVTQGYLAGFGKYFSRFLYLLPEEVEADLRTENERLSGDKIAEICGEASFNADLHPALLPAEISYPTGTGGVTEGQIPIPDLVVEPDPKRDFRLRLCHLADDREVLPVDLGFQNPQTRPPLFQLLSRMTPATAFALWMPERPEEPTEARNGADEPPRVLYRPRLSYRGRLVLARRRWTLPGTLHVRRQRRESEAEYFLRLQRWRAELGLPEEVFVRVRPVRRGNIEDTERPAPQVREHVDKPQYIDFKNPLLVDLFGRLAENHEDFLVILEERLPGRDQLLAGAGRRYVTEWILQVDFPSRER